VCIRNVIKVKNKTTTHATLLFQFRLYMFHISWCSTFFTTTTHGSSLESCLDTCALSSTTLLASTLQEFSTSLCSFWNSCPTHVRSTLILFLPTPVTWVWKLGRSYHHLGPAVTCLVCSPLRVLDECILCRRKAIHGSASLCEELFASLVDKHLTAGTVIQ